MNCNSYLEMQKKKKLIKMQNAKSLKNKYSAKLKPWDESEDCLSLLRDQLTKSRLKHIRDTI
jgi:hypothetical protein